MAVPDADYCLISVQFGAYCSSNDSNVFKNSTFGKLLESNKLDIPEPTVLPGDAEGLCMPFLLVVDEAFALSEHVLRPYPKKKMLICLKHVAKSTKVVECNFGILGNKWRKFRRPIDVKPEVCDIIKACCFLHNYVRKNDTFCSMTLCMNVP